MLRSPRSPPRGRAVTAGLAAGWRRARRQLPLAAIGHRPPAAPSPLIGSIPRMGKSFTFRAALTDEHDHRDGAA